MIPPDKPVIERALAFIEKEIPKLGKVGDSFKFTVPDEYIDIITTKFACSKEELPKRLSGKVWFVWQTGRLLPYIVYAPEEKEEDRDDG